MAAGVEVNADLDGTVSILKERPDKEKRPVVLFSSRSP
jgi:hypothetical protein